MLLFSYKFCFNTQLVKVWVGELGPWHPFFVSGRKDGLFWNPYIGFSCREGIGFGVPTLVSGRENFPLNA
jgi:hypothetical protein